MVMRLGFLVFVFLLFAVPIFAQDKPNPAYLGQSTNLDPELLSIKLDGCNNLLDFREKQMVQVSRQVIAERAYWASYVAGLAPKTN